MRARRRARVFVVLCVLFRSIRYVVIVCLFVDAVNFLVYIYIYIHYYLVCSLYCSLGAPLVFARRSVVIWLAGPSAGATMLSPEARLGLPGTDRLCAGSGWLACSVARSLGAPLATQG